MLINKIGVQYLQDGKEPFDGLVQEKIGESNNNLAVTDEIYHGSLQSLNVSITTSVIEGKLNSRDIFSGIGAFGGGSNIYPNVYQVPVTQTVLSGNLIYTGFLRNSSGTGYTTWKRPTVSEAEPIENIWLKTTIAQYHRSWKKITGTVYGDVFFSMANVIKDLDNTVYLPISLEYDDKMNSWNGEFLELVDISAETGKAYSSGFTNGFS